MGELTLQQIQKRKGKTLDKSTKSSNVYYATRRKNLHWCWPSRLMEENEGNTDANENACKR